MNGAPATAAPFLAAVLILGVAGAAKFVRPSDTARALRVAGLPGTRNLVRVGAAAEMAVAVSAVAAPGVATGSLVAAAYAGFAAFVLVALQKGWPLTSCGCFGRPDARPGWAHAVLDLGACGSAAWWARSGPGPLGPLFYHQPWHGVPLALVALTLAGMAYLIWTNPLENVHA